MVYPGSTDAAPEVPHLRPMRRDAATRRGRRCLRIRPRRATWIPRDFRRLAPTRLRLELIHSESGRYGRNGRFRPKFKKKKKVQNAPFDLILNPTSTQFHLNAKTPLLTFRLTSLSSLCLCALCLSATLPLFRLPCCINSFFLQLSLTHS